MNLTPGQTITLSGIHEVAETIVIPSNVTIKSDKNNPLVWKRVGSCVRMFYFAGSNITLTGDIDLNCAGQWPAYQCAWAFSAPFGVPVHTGFKNNITIHDVDAYSSTPIGPHDGRDMWLASLTSDSDTLVDKFTMRNVKNRIPKTQLIGNGNGIGFKRGRITNCSAIGGHAAGMAISSSSGDHSDQKSTLHTDWVIEYCDFKNSYAFGGFFGQDRENPPARVSFKNLTVRHSRFHLAADGADYQFALLLRAGVSGEFEASFRHCVFDLSDCKKEARFIHCQTEAKLDFGYCVFVGEHENYISNKATVSQVGNRQLFSGGWRPYLI